MKNYRQWKKYYKYFRGKCKADGICRLFCDHTTVENYVIIRWHTPQKMLRKQFRELVK